MSKFLTPIAALLLAALSHHAQAYDRYLGMDNEGFAHYLVDNRVVGYGAYKQADIMRIVVKDKLKDRLGIDGYYLYSVEADCSSRTMATHRRMKWEETGALLGDESYPYASFQRIAPNSWRDKWYQAICRY